MKKNHTEGIKNNVEKMQRLIESEVRFKDYAEASADWFWESDEALNITSVVGDVHNFDVINLSEIANSCYSHSSNVALKTFQSHQKFTDLILQTAATIDDQAITYTRISGKPITNQNGDFVGYRGAGLDVTEMITLSRRIEFLASHDELTGLPNRSMFRQRLEHATAKAKRADTQLLLLFFNLDYFKKINETLGSKIGDELLIKAVARIASYTRSTDILFRLGGDEFVMIMEGASPQDGHRIIREIINGFSKPFLVHDQDIYCSQSIGVSVFPDDTQEAEKLFVFADLALSRAKNKGRNSFEFYTPGLNDAAHQWLQMEQDIGYALKNGELFMVFQPQFNVELKKITGMEALLRWRHPKRGSIPPTEFIKIAEQSSLINQIGEFVITSCCKQIRLWLDAGFIVPRVSINISYRHLRSNLLIQTLQDAVSESQIDTEMLCIEISERAVLEDDNEVRKSILSIKAAGISISLDDFGTTNASFLNLKRWAVDEVKVDHAFVSGLNREDADSVVVKAIIALSGILGVDLIGMGVENENQNNMLVENGCKTMQGFFYAEPLIAKDLEKRLKK